MDYTTILENPDKVNWIDDIFPTTITKMEAMVLSSGEWYTVIQKIIDMTASKSIYDLYPTHIKTIQKFIFVWSKFNLIDLHPLASRLTRKLNKITLTSTVRKLDKITISASDYPDVSNPYFNSILTEYSDFNIKGKVYTPTVKEVSEIADKLCNASIELSTYQTVVRNFLSNDTPYNGLLLYHGLGTGKTCSAITISEEHRKFLKQSGLGTIDNKRGKRIYILGGPNIKSNFRKQLFDESHLSEEGGEWVCKSCVGNAFLREINPSGVKMTREDIVKQMDELIHKYYRFMGYIKFANRISVMTTTGLSIESQIKHEYENCMIVIDEIHNIKNNDKNAMGEDTGNFTPSEALDLVTKYTTVKLLLLSATPIFNSPIEIVWLMNLLHQNDKTETIDVKDFFEDDNLIEGMESEFIQHTRGYVSFVKGENPFTFPYRVYPEHFEKHNVVYPTIGFYGNKITPLRTQVFPVEIIENQMETYKEVRAALDENRGDKMANSIDLDKSVLSVLNMTYPGKESNIEAFMNHTKPNLYAYKEGTEHCFDLANLRNYSAKIHNICKCIENSEGIVMIYSKLIERGVVPMALALESMGYVNIHKNLLDGHRPKIGTYCLITGSTLNNAINISKLNARENEQGAKIKVVIISEAASEGVDLKNIRQIHIMDPWWHLNRNEQIIGRGIRLCSHKTLQFEHRNAQIFLYVSVLDETELVDHYMYRYAEEKAVKTGKITRLLKENAMDCVMNHEQFQSIQTMNIVVPQILSNGTHINYPIGDKSYSIMCDFMKDCEYECAYTEKKQTIVSVLFNVPRTIEQIRVLFRKGYVYKSSDLFRELNLRNTVSYGQLYEALSQMVDFKTECKDGVNRSGYIVNHGDYYMFQPNQLKGSIPIYERRIPVSETIPFISILPKKINKIDENLTKTMRVQYEEALLDASKSNETKDNWYSLVPQTREHLRLTLLQKEIVMDDELLNECIIGHIVEMLLYDECKELLNHLLNEVNEFEQHLKDYFEIKNGIVCLWNYEKLSFLKLEGTWKEYHVNEKLVPLPDFGNVVGGITNNGDDNRVFKTRDMSISEITHGQICKNHSHKPIGLIESVLNVKEYDSLSRNKICCELELLLRYLEKIKHKHKKWFLSSIEVIRESNRYVSIKEATKKSKEKIDLNKIINLIKPRNEKK
jgi:hypothetical protein